MDLKKLQTLDALTPQTPVKIRKPDLGVGPSFKDTLDKVGTPGAPNLAQMPSVGAAKLPSEAVKALPLEAVKFSNHAIERMRTRGISYSPDDIAKLGDAVQRAAAKGSKDSLILMNDSALIVSVKNNTVVTVMDKNALKENVFTNIDSTVVL